LAASRFPMPVAQHLHLTGSYVAVNQCISLVYYGLADVICSLFYLNYFIESTTHRISPILKLYTSQEASFVISVPGE